MEGRSAGTRRAACNGEGGSSAAPSAKAAPRACACGRACKARRLACVPVAAVEVSRAGDDAHREKETPPVEHRHGRRLQAAALRLTARATGWHRAYKWVATRNFGRIGCLRGTTRGAEYSRAIIPNYARSRAHVSAFLSHPHVTHLPAPGVADLSTKASLRVVCSFTKLPQQPQLQYLLIKYITSPGYGI